MPLKKIKKKVKHRHQHQQQRPCQHSKYFFGSNPSIYNKMFSGMNSYNNLPGISAMASSSQHNPDMNNQIWQYVVMKYIYNLMYGQPETKVEKEKELKITRSEENVDVKKEADKPQEVLNIDSSIVSFMKSINISTENSSTSTTDLTSGSDISSPEVSAQNNLLTTCINSAGKNTSESETSTSSSDNTPENSNKDIVRNKLDNMNKAEKESNNDEDDDDDDEDEDDESSDEEEVDSRLKEPSMRTVMQMMEKFCMMQNMFNGPRMGTMF